MGTRIFQLRLHDIRVPITRREEENRRRKGGYQGPIGKKEQLHCCTLLGKIMQVPSPLFQSLLGAADRPPERTRIFGFLPISSRPMLRKSADWRPSGFVEPCRPTEAAQPPSGSLWVHEIKH